MFRLCYIYMPSLFHGQMKDATWAQKSFFLYEMGYSFHSIEKTKVALLQYISATFNRQKCHFWYASVALLL